MTSQNLYAVPDERTRLQRLLARLFPTAVPAPFEPDHVAWAPHWMRTDVVVTLDWRDRLRVLFGGPLHITSHHQTDVTVDRVLTHSSFHVAPPRFRRGGPRNTLPLSF